MSIIEEKMMGKAIKWLSRIGRELARANRLKEYELRGQLSVRRGEDVASKQALDEIMED